MSAIEALTNVVVGFLLALVAQSVVLPAFGLYVTATSNLAIAGIFTVVSLARSYVLRRLFEAVRV